MNIKKRIADATIKDVVILISFIVGLCFVALNHEKIFIFLGVLYKAVAPFIYGLCIAFVFHLPMSFFMRILPVRQDGKKQKLVAAMLTLFCFIVIITLIIWIIVPKIVDNIVLLVHNFDRYKGEIEKMIEVFFSDWGFSEEMIQIFVNSLIKLSDTMIATLQALVPSMINMIAVIANSILNIIFSLLIAMYLVISKDALISQCKRMGKVLLNQKRYQIVYDLVQLTNETFVRFISGQGIEAVIISLLCYLGCKLLGFEYASIVSVIIGVTNMIPIFGAIIGTLAAALLIAFTDPLQGMIFLVFGICLQQFESNLIYPHVVGSSVGLSPIWVLFAVTIGGSIFGAAGMIFGLPVFSIIYEVFRRFIRRKEKLLCEE